ncbi:hypothetical protein RRG08_033686 [Elysia crispata]|uniref:Uncharacterized protein n=1 Tax=Elysia crispata TaxID=231223 RepID=A0AAE1A8U3_9GAST|nr:hypothetical protein RRG08_033686 [Elysia crispata]
MSIVLFRAASDNLGGRKGVKGRATGAIIQLLDRFLYSSLCLSLALLRFASSDLTVVTTHKLTMLGIGNARSVNRCHCE